MSRVTDALERVFEERAQRKTSGSAERERVNPNVRFNGEAVAEPIRGPLPTVPEISAAKTWREKFEELLFGRDLSRLPSHPLIALEKNSPAAEQYRILREQVRTHRHATGARSISITSPLKHDGKTMVAVNLAVAMALGGQERVLLIDGDLRDPDVHKFFGFARYPGLSDYLSSDYGGNLSQYVRPTLIPGLQVITAGKASELAGELLAKQRMKSLMEEISATYPDCQVVIDSSPVLATSDPLVLAREVGGVILVIRAGKTHREYLKKAVETLNSPKLIGLVLNGADFGMSVQHYHYVSLQPES